MTNTINKSITWGQQNPSIVSLAKTYTMGSDGVVWWLRSFVAKNSEEKIEEHVKIVLCTKSRCERSQLKMSLLAWLSMVQNIV